MLGLHEHVLHICTRLDNYNIIFPRGARHGLTLSGKLARIERQEAAVLPLRESVGACMDESVQNTGKKKKKSMQVDRKGKPKRLKKSASAIISTC